MSTDQQSQTNQKEHYELKKKEKWDYRAGQLRKEKMKKTIVWLIVAFVIGAAAYGLFIWLEKSAKERPGQAMPIQGVQHIEVGASHPAYNSNPPTSGWHYEDPVEWGIHQEELIDEQVIHNLEHGGIRISYKDIDDETKSRLEEIGKKYSTFVVVSPRSENDAKIALASWGRLDKFDIFDEARIVNFIKQNKNKSPEPIAR